MMEAPAVSNQDSAPLGTLRKEQAAEHLLKSRFFSKSPLMSAFLSYVCRRAIEDPSARITEHEIGMHVFGRGEDFDTREDNIVRNYARQLRKRLQEYYAAEGADDPVHIDIPRGGYAPLFTEGAPSSFSPSATWPLESKPEADPAKPPSLSAPAWTMRHHRWLPALAGLLALLCVAAVGIYRMALWRPPAQAPAPEQRLEALRPLWSQLFNASRDTFIVLPDTGFVIMQQANHRTLSLSEYLQWHDGSGPPPNLAMYYLRSEDYTSTSAVNIANRLRDLKEVVPNRLLMRAAPDMRFEDFQNSNIILIGSNFSNPWTELFSKHTTFLFHNDLKADHYWIENIHPQAEEPRSYESHYKDHTHITYATIAFLPNLGGTGHVLLLQGLDSAGTQAVADFMMRDEGQKTVLEQMKAIGKGTANGFELLFEVVSLDYGIHTTDLRVIARRQYTATDTAE